ncbi:MAG: response regulator transcription factor [Phycisphaerae bacterium]
MAIRVLLVDDHQLFRQGLRSMLANDAGIEVIGEAENGRSAVELARQLVPDVIVMDISMPDLNGIEATRQIKERSPGTQILALSAFPDRRFVTGILAAGATGYILKDAAFEELCRAIRAVNSGKVYLGPEIGPVLAETYIGKSAGTDTPGATSLTRRQREILQLIAEGLTTKQIARQLARSAKTVEMHRRHLMEKLNLHGVADLTKYAIRRGLTSLDA